MSKIGRWNPEIGKVEWSDAPTPPRSTDLPACPDTYSTAKPLVSKSMSVHPSQAAEFNEMAKRDGNTGAHYDPRTGDVHFTSRKARAQESRRRGVADFDAGYGDYAGS